MIRPLIFATPIIFFPALTYGALGHDLLQQNIVNCSQLADNNARLMCFDDLSIKVVGTINVDKAHAAKASTVIAPATQLASVPVSVAASTKTRQNKRDFNDKAAEDFGLIKKKQDIDKHYLFTVKKTKTDLYGKLIFTFANGQVWKQRDDRTRMPFTGAVTIKKGMLGSFFLFKKGSKSKIKVKRIK
jgi:hypothetical protein